MRVRDAERVGEEDEAEGGGEELALGEAPRLANRDVVSGNGIALDVRFRPNYAKTSAKVMGF